MQNLPRGCQEFQSLLPKQTGSLGAKVGSEQNPKNLSFFFWPNTALAVSPLFFWVLHPFIGVLHLSLAQHLLVCKAVSWSWSLGQGCQQFINKYCLIWGNSCVPVLIVGMPEKKWTSAAPVAGTECRIMLAATITAALIYFMVQSSGALALGTACWDERLSRAGRNNSCVGESGWHLSYLDWHSKFMVLMDVMFKVLQITGYSLYRRYFCP